MTAQRHVVLFSTLCALALAVGGAAGAQTTRPADDPPATQPAREAALTEREKIAALIEHVEQLENAVFIRNGVEHDADDAADHMRMKLRYAGNRVKTAEQFIERIASESSTTGKPYHIRLADGTTHKSGEYLRQVLERLETGGEPNPAAPGFNREASDARAIEIADLVMRALGGREAWDDTRFIAWNFFGMRQLVWNRQTGDVRIEGTTREQQPYVVIMNIHTKEGDAWVAGDKVADPERLKQMLDMGQGAWVNDSYWLVMPYKMKDAGVTLIYRGEEETEAGDPAWKLQLTFDEVGRTPRNKYHVWVDRESHLVTQWSYFADAADDEPRLTTPWTGWKTHDGIMLSGGRGEREITDIAVFDRVPQAVFESPDGGTFERLVEQHRRDDATDEGG